MSSRTAVEVFIQQLKDEVANLHEQLFSVREEIAAERDASLALFATKDELAEVSDTLLRTNRELEVVGGKADSCVEITVFEQLRQQHELLEREVSYKASSHDMESVQEQMQQAAASLASKGSADLVQNLQAQVGQLLVDVRNFPSSEQFDSLAQDVSKAAKTAEAAATGRKRWGKSTLS